MCDIVAAIEIVEQVDGRAVISPINKIKDQSWKMSTRKSKDNQTKKSSRPYIQAKKITFAPKGIVSAENVLETFLGVFFQKWNENGPQQLPRHLKFFWKSWNTIWR